MRSSVGPLAILPLAGALLFGCAKPTPSDTGTAGTTGGGNTSGSAGTSGGGNTSRSGGTTGGGNSSGSAGSSATGTAGTGGPACVSDPTNLVRSGGWICGAAQPCTFRGAWYGYGDGTSCPASTPNPCAPGNCCM